MDRIQRTVYSIGPFVWFPSFSVRSGCSLKTFSKSCSESDGSLSIDETDGGFTPDEGSAFPPAKTFK